VIRQIARRNKSTVQLHRSPLFFRCTQNGRRQNNLADGGIALLGAVEAAGLPAEDLNFYIAGLYNSEVAIEFLEQAGSGTPFGIKVPGPGALELARELCTGSRRMRNLFRIQRITEGRDAVDANDLDPHFPAKLLSSLGLERPQRGSSRFKTRVIYTVPANAQVSSNWQMLYSRTSK
jgi:hypothetical protein